MAEPYVCKEVSAEIAAQVVDTVRKELSGLAWICYDSDTARVLSAPGSQLVQEELDEFYASPKGTVHDVKDHGSVGPAVIRFEAYGDNYMLSVFDYSDRKDDDLAKSVDDVDSLRAATLKARELFKDLPEACGRNFPDWNRHE